MTSPQPLRLASPGHAAFALTMIGLGVFGFITGDFTSVWQPVPHALPGRQVLLYLCSAISVAGGIGLIWQRTAAVASRALLVWFLAWLLLLRVPLMVIAFGVNTWWSTAQVAVMLSAAWVLYAWFATGFATGEQGLRSARLLYGVGLIPFGIAHFLFLDATTVLIPGWIPGHVFWAYFTGAAFMAAGIAPLIGVWARLATVLSVVMVGLFTLIVWVPVVVPGHPNPGQLQEFIASVAITAAGWVVAESYRGTPWFAVGRSDRRPQEIPAVRK